MVWREAGSLSESDSRGCFARASAMELVIFFSGLIGVMISQKPYLQFLICFCGSSCLIARIAEIYNLKNKGWKTIGIQAEYRIGVNCCR